jgi:hypothetical protein
MCAALRAKDDSMAYAIWRDRGSTLRRSQISHPHFHGVACRPCIRITRNRCMRCIRARDPRVARHRRIDPEMALQRGEVDQDAVLLERRHSTAVQLPLIRLTGVSITAPPPRRVLGGELARSARRAVRSAWDSRRCPPLHPCRAVAPSSGESVDSGAVARVRGARNQGQASGLLPAAGMLGERARIAVLVAQMAEDCVDDVIFADERNISRGNWPPRAGVLVSTPSRHQRALRSRQIAKRPSV